VLPEGTRTLKGSVKKWDQNREGKNLYLTKRTGSGSPGVKDWVEFMTRTARRTGFGNQQASMIPARNDGMARILEKQGEE